MSTDTDIDTETAAVVAAPDHRLARWEHDSTWPLGAAAVVFLACYSTLVLHSDMSPQLRRSLRLIDYATWAMFVVDYVVRLSLARPRGRWFLRNLPELLVVVLPVLRPLRLLRLVVLVRLLNRWASSSLRGRVGAYVATGSILVVYSGALAELSAERGAPGSNIESFGTSLWWAVSTVTTVGYGDHFPVTIQGRLVASALMVAGIALIGTVTASIATYLVDRVSSEKVPVVVTDPVSGLSTADEVRALRAQVAELTDLLRADRAAQGSDGAGRGAT